MVMLHSSTTNKRTIKMFAQIQEVINAVLMCQIFCGDLMSPERQLSWAWGEQGSTAWKHLSWPGSVWGCPKRQIAIRPKYPVAPTQPHASKFLRLHRAKHGVTAALVNRALCPQKGCFLQAVHFTPRSRLLGQMAVVRAAEEWKGFFCLFLSPALFAPCGNLLNM